MFRTSFLLLGLTFLPLAAPALAADTAPPISQWVPQDAVATLDVVKPRAVLDVALEPKTVSMVTSLPAYEKATAQQGYRQFRAGVAFLEALLNTDWQTATRKLTGGGIHVSLHPNGGVLLIAEAEDTALLNRLHETLVSIAKSEAEKAGQPNRVQSKEYQGVTAWTFGGEDAHAIVGNRLLLSNKAELLRAALDLRAKPAESVDGQAAYKAAKKACGSEGAAWAFVNMELIKQNPQIRDALEKTENPLAALLFAGIRDALKDANWLGLQLKAEKDAFSLQATVDTPAGQPSKASAFARPAKADEGAPNNLSVPRRIAALSLYRDLHGFYAAKDDLFPDRTSGLIFFENMMGIFFTGRDLTDDVLGKTQPEVRVVVAGQTYDAAVGTPRTQLPAFATIFRMKDAKKSALMMEEAWQKALGLVNFTRGQQAQAGLIIDRPVHDGTQFSVARFAPPEKGETKDLDTRYNFSPALAMVGDCAVLSSTEGLAKDLIDALKREQAGAVNALAGTNSLLELDGAGIGTILAANRENLVQQNMLEKGHTQEEAEGEIGLLISLIKALGQAKLIVANHDGQTTATVELKLQRP